MTPTPRPSSTFIVALLALTCHHATHALSVADRAQTARSRLSEAFRSPSKKLTLHPELILPEPSDPTALLLRSSEVMSLSEAVRKRAKANAAFVSGTVDALRPMGAEQEKSRGNFPGPVPLVYCLTQKQFDGLSGGEDGGDDAESLLSEVADAGAEGVLVPFFGGEEIAADTGVEGKSLEAARKCCDAILGAGMQPIPEVVLANGEAEWSEESLEKLVDALKDACGGEDPVSVLLTAASVFSDNEESDDMPEEGDDANDGKIPAGAVPTLAITPTLGKRLTFLGSVRVDAGEGRMGAAASEIKSAGFHGAFLRADCVPGYRMNPDLKLVGGFWSAAIGDLKSLKSKSFSFRSKTKIEKDVPMEWYNYQKDIMDSGALGGASHAGPAVDSSAGDFVGF